MQVYYETMFDGPWYECKGPSFTDVKKDLKTKYKRGYRSENDYLKKIYIENIFDSHKIIDNVLDEKITETLKFGSWRGYSTFGVQEDILRNINSDINKKIYANITLQKKLTPLVRHYLYKPGGIRTIELEKDFENKQSTS
jgi:Mor family transcriptional regulator